MKNPYSIIASLLFVCLNSLQSLSVPKSDVSSGFRTETLSAGWKMQPGDRLTGIDEKIISANGFDTQNWYNAIVPGTVMGALSDYKIIEDATYGINMQKVDAAQFKQPWWFRTTFKLKASDLKKKVTLHFNGINYRADLWVNGQKVVGMDTFAGAYRMFSFNINPYIREGENTLALKMIQFVDGEYSIGFCDWNPLPADRNLGIFRDVFLEVNNGIKIRSPFVYSKVDTVSKSMAD